MSRFNTIVDVKNPTMNISDVDFSLDLFKEIQRLKEEKNAIILAHYYQDEDIQDVADFIGDSLDLSRKAANTQADVIVFCGVRFMAEVAKILSPEKTVLLPDGQAGCSLEDSCPPEKFEAFRREHPDHLALTYINCSAEVKGLSDIIVTSSNALDVINSIPKSQPILFAPDRHLGRYLSQKSKRDMLLWPGTCIVHERFSERELIRLKVEHPKAPVIAHPECHQGILDHADFVGSTRALLNYTMENEWEKFLVATEPNIFHQMRKSSPHKEFIGVPGQDGQCNCNYCPFMALNTLEKLYLCLVNMGPSIDMPEDLRLRAHLPLEKMLALSSCVQNSDVGRGER